jgi:hypothetical protein
MRSKEAGWPRQGMTLMSKLGPVTEGDRQQAIDLARTRASRNYFLNWVQLISEAWDGDILTGIIFLAIVNENTRMVLKMDLNPSTFSSGVELPPDEMRLPVSVYVLSKTLGLSYETTRRHVAKLIDRGLCIRVSERGGLLVPRSVLARDATGAVVAKNLENLDQLLSALACIGR